MKNNIHVFISYGHQGKTRLLADRLYKDLNGNKDIVNWIDKSELCCSVEWENKIENAIINSDWLIILMSDYSVRRPDGVCLDEVSFARGLSKNILPLMVQDVIPPLCITRLQWMDATKLVNDDGSINEELYLQKLSEIMDILKGKKGIDTEGAKIDLLKTLKPINNDVYFTSISKTIGRQWLLDKVRYWLDEQKNSKMFILFGAPGTGKTLFSALCATKIPEVVGIHFCKFNDSDRSDPKKAIISLSYHLSTQIPDYAQELISLKDLNHLEEKSVSRLFSYLFIEPLSKINKEKRDMLLIIDALDESCDMEKSALIELIEKEFEYTPSWLRLIVTARRERDIEIKLQKYNPTVIEKCEQNVQDIAEYFKSELPSLNKEKCDLLAEKCEGSFLYARELVNAINNNACEIDDIGGFPVGMNGIYYSYFTRLFGKDKEFYQTKVRRVLEIILSSFEPCTKKKIMDIGGINEYEFEEIYGQITTLFPISDNKIHPIHKSLYDWLINAEKCGDFLVSYKFGHKRMLDYCLRSPNDYYVKHSIRHALRAEEFEMAAELLGNSDLLALDVRLEGQDSALRKYTEELFVLASHDALLAQSVMCSAGFKKILAENRVFLYDSGLFFKLKSSGFDHVATDLIKTNDFELQTAVAYYFYVTENFDFSVKLFNKLIRNTDADAHILAGIYNTLGLCYRKFGRYAEAVSCWENGRKLSENNDKYEESRSFINSGRTLYHLLDWEGSYFYSDKAVECLDVYCEEEFDDDKIIAVSAFKGEYIRLIAEAAIWQNNKEKALKYLEEDRLIYEKSIVKDRYYVRYLYTRFLYDILYDATSSDIELEYTNLKNTVTSKYDKSQIELFMAYRSFLMSDTQKAIAYAESAKKLSSSINAVVETDEAQLVINICSNKDYNDNITEKEDKNWISYVNDFLLEKKNEIDSIRQ